MEEDVLGAGGMVEDGMDGSNGPAEVLGVKSDCQVD